MDVILIAGYRQDSEALGLTEHAPGLIHLDHQIKQLKSLGLSPVVVLAGHNSDEVLRKSKELDSCELIFDTHNSESSLMSGLRAGLHGVEQTCFALPIEIPCPPKAVWVQLRKTFLNTGFSTKIAMIQLTQAEGAPWHWGFPLFITRLGRHLILNDDTILSLTDSKLKYEHSIFETAEGLAVDSSSL